LFSPERYFASRSKTIRAAGIREPKVNATTGGTMTKLPVLDAEDEDDEYPPCFGQLWEKFDADCRKCLCFSTCGEKMTGAKVDPLERYRGIVAPPQVKVAPQVAPTLGETPRFFPSENPRLFPSAATQVQDVLSVREPMDPNERPWNYLGRALLRGMGKAIGMTIANFFDQTPLRNLFRKK
jgi:hypothetical protein